MRRNATDGKIRKWVWAVVNNFFDFWTFHVLGALCKRETKVSSSTKYFFPCILHELSIYIFYSGFEFFVVSLCIVSLLGAINAGTKVFMTVNELNSSETVETCAYSRIFFPFDKVNAIKFNVPTEGNFEKRS